MTSPLARDPRAHQVCGLTESLMNRTEPSAKPMLTPPGCMLFGEAVPYTSIPHESTFDELWHCREFGVPTWL